MIASTRSIALILLGTTALSCAATPALAGWESVYAGPATDSAPRCSVDQSRGPAKVRASESRAVRMAGDATHLIEIYGHGIDLDTNVSITGPGGVSANWYGRANGAANARGGCGAIGSMRVRVRLPSVTRDTSATLRVGSERIPITIITKSQLNRVEWTPESASDFVVPANAPANLPAELAGQVKRPPLFSVSTPQCQPGAAGACAPATGVRLENSGASGPRAQQSLSDTLARCIAPYGGKAILAGDRLTIRLPDQRIGGITNCWSKYTVAFALQLFDDPDFGGGIEPALTTSLTNANGIARTQGDDDPALTKIFFDRNFLSNHVGSQAMRFLATNVARQTRDLDLIIESEVPYGIDRITSPISLQSSVIGTGATRFTGVPRPSAGSNGQSLTQKLSLAVPGATGQVFRWHIAARPNSGSPNATTCFQAVDGDVRPTVGAASVDVVLAQRDNAVCDGKAYIFSAAPFERDRDALYTASAEIIL